MAGYLLDSQVQLLRLILDPVGQDFLENNLGEDCQRVLPVRLVEVIKPVSEVAQVVLPKVAEAPPVA